jgi:hypothetical protein
MRTAILKTSLVSLVSLAMTMSVARAEEVPFKGTFMGQAVSAVPTDDPNVVLVTTEGGGRATDLGKFTMVSPHLSNLVTLGVEGTQNFTAANGDMLTAEFTGQFVPMGGGFLAASIECTIAGGTGRFQGATGNYTFDIVFDTATLTDVASIAGTLVLSDED